MSHILAETLHMKKTAAPTAPVCQGQSLLYVGMAPDEYIHMKLPYSKSDFAPP